MAVTTGILGARTLAAAETRASFERPYGLAWLLQFRTRAISSCRRHDEFPVGSAASLYGTPEHLSKAANCDSYKGGDGSCFPKRRPRKF